MSASASSARGKEAGDDLTHTNTHITAGNVVRIQSGGDTTLQGALVKAETIQAEVGGNLRAQASAETDPDKRVQLNAQADQLEAAWGDNGTLRLLAHTVVGGLTGGASGAAGAATGTLAAPAVADALASAGVGGALASTLTAIASTAVGVAAAGGTAGGAAALNEVANNYLKHADVQKLSTQLKACGNDKACHDKAFEEAYRVSIANDIALLSCQSTANCDALKAEFREGYEAIGKMLDAGIKPNDVSLVLNLETNAQTIIRNGLDQIQCNTPACKDKANHLVGIGKGLAKITPAGLVTGSGVMVYELITALSNVGLAETAVAVASGVAGLPADIQNRLNSNDPQVRGEALVDALSLGTVATAVTAKMGQLGYTAVVRQVEAKAVAAAEAQVIAARMKEVAIHVDDARFSQVAQQIVQAEKAGWKTTDGKTWWPPENGKVPGTDQIVELKAGQPLDRYGGTSDKSTFLAPAETPLGQRALPDSTNFAVRDEYVVIKPFRVEESRVMPWFGKEGMGLQYETNLGMKMTIEDLVEKGYLKKVSP